MLSYARQPPLLSELSEIARELQADADVVLHAPDLSADGHDVLLEGGLGLLVLVRVDLHLLPELDEHGWSVSGHDGLPDVDASLVEHEGSELTHGVLDGVCGEDAEAVVLVVPVKAGVLRAGGA